MIIIGRVPAPGYTICQYASLMQGQFWALPLSSLGNSLATTYALKQAKQISLVRVRRRRSFNVLQGRSCPDQKQPLNKTGTDPVTRGMVNPLKAEASSGCQ